MLRRLRTAALTSAGMSLASSMRQRAPLNSITSKQPAKPAHRALQELGIPFRARPRPGEAADATASSGSGGSALTQRHSSTLAGLQGYVKNTLRQYKENGDHLAKVVAVQASANQVSDRHQRDGKTGFFSNLNGSSYATAHGR